MKRRKSFFEKNPLHLKKIDPAEEDDVTVDSPLVFYVVLTAIIGTMLLFGLWICF